MGCMLMTIGCLIFLIMLIAIYQINRSRMKTLNFRQHLYKIMIFTTVPSLIFEVFEAVGYQLQNTFIYYAAWKLHWALALMFYFSFYYYFCLLFNVGEPKKFIEVFWDKGKFTWKNMFTIALFIVVGVAMVFVNPAPFNEPFVILTAESLYICYAMLFIYIVFLGQFMFKNVFYNKNVKRVDIYITIAILFFEVLFLTLQIIFPRFAFLGPGIVIIIVILYFFYENIDLLTASELDSVKKNIEKSSNAKLDFLYNMSHDIRSPMNAIVGLSKDFKDSEEFNDETVKKDIKSIKYSCSTLVDIVNNLLDVNKIASGTEDLQYKEYNLNQLISEMPNIIETRIGSRPIKFIMDIDQNIPSLMYGDTVKLYRVILNILTNSVKYTEVGRIKLRIVGTRNGNTELLSIKISDTGYGIKKEDFDKLFTKFNRLDDASDNNIEGTGLGLVITKKYVDMMGGKIWFESEYKAGTTFYVELPQKIVDSTPLSDVTELDEDGKIKLTDCSGKRALVVDDNRLNLVITKKILEKFNFEVETTDNGQDCIYRIKSGEKFDIIFLDHVLPDIDGIEIARVLKRIDGYVIPPIVAFTANVMNGIREKYLAAGFDEYLAKPIEISQFNNVVKKFCEVKKPEQEVVQAQETVTQAN